MTEHPDLTWRVIGPDDTAHLDLADGSSLAAQVHGFGEAVSRAFLDRRGTDERHRRALEHLRADAVVLRGAWEDRPPHGDGAIPVATLMSFDKSLDVGGARTAPLHMITDVTVSPAHRRRGLVRRLITEDLADAAARGVPLAALTVSEGAIYGRFGFGAATWMRRVEVDTGPRFALRPDVVAGLGEDPGRFLVVEPDAAWPAVRDVFAREHAQVRGSVERPQFYEPMLSGAYSFEHDAPDHKLRAVLHLAADGQADGYVLYSPAGEVDGVQTLDVDAMGATDPGTYLRLWRFLAEMDLVRRVRRRRAPVDDPLEHALVEPRVVRTVEVRDLLWVRVLDVVAALEARPWYADGEVVLEVEDDLGHAAGRWRVEVADGAARVTPTEDPAGVRLGADTLGSLYLGGVAVATLHAAGRVPGSAEAVRRLAALADGGPAPYCSTGF